MAKKKSAQAIRMKEIGSSALNDFAEETLLFPCVHGEGMLCGGDNCIHTKEEISESFLSFSES